MPVSQHTRTLAQHQVWALSLDENRIDHFDYTTDIVGRCYVGADPAVCTDAYIFDGTIRSIVVVNASANPAPEDRLYVGGDFNRANQEGPIATIELPASGIVAFNKDGEYEDISGGCNDYWGVPHPTAPNDNTSGGFTRPPAANYIPVVRRLRATCGPDGCRTLVVAGGLNTVSKGYSSLVSGLNRKMEHIPIQGGVFPDRAVTETTIGVRGMSHRLTSNQIINGQPVIETETLIFGGIYGAHNKYISVEDTDTVEEFISSQGAILYDGKYFRPTVEGRLGGVLNCSCAAWYKAPAANTGHWYAAGNVYDSWQAVQRLIPEDTATETAAYWELVTGDITDVLPSPYGTINCMAVFNGKLWVGGWMYKDTLGVDPFAAFLVTWDGLNWEAVNHNNSDPYTHIYLQIPQSMVVVDLEDGAGEALYIGTAVQNTPDPLTDIYGADPYYSRIWRVTSGSVLEGTALGDSIAGSFDPNNPTPAPGDPTRPAGWPQMQRDVTVLRTTTVCGRVCLLAGLSGGSGAFFPTTGGNSDSRYDNTVAFVFDPQGGSAGNGVWYEALSEASGLGVVVNTVGGYPSMADTGIMVGGGARYACADTDTCANNDALWPGHPDLHYARAARLAFTFPGEEMCECTSELGVTTTAPVEFDSTSWDDLPQGGLNGEVLTIENGNSVKPILECVSEPPGGLDIVVPVT